MNALVPSNFIFNKSSEIRTVLIDNDVWFVAKDIFETLSLTWNGTKTLLIIPETWKSVVKLTTSPSKGVVNLTTPFEELQNKRGGGVQDTHVINFKAVCKIAFRSNKPEADNFTNWAAEVIEQVLKTGQYQVPKPITEKREYLTGTDIQNIKRLVWSCSSFLDKENAFSNAVWHSLRKVTGVPSPANFEVSHLPILATEFKRIFSIIEPYINARQQCEKILIKRLLREREDVQLLDELLATMSMSASQAMHLKAKESLDKIFNQDCLRLIHRTA